MPGQISIKFPLEYLFELMDAISTAEEYLHNPAWSVSRAEQALTFTVPQSESKFASMVSYFFTTLVGLSILTAEFEEEENYHLPIAP